MRGGLPCAHHRDKQTPDLVGLTRACDQAKLSGQWNVDPASAILLHTSELLTWRGSTHAGVRVVSSTLDVDTDRHARIHIRALSCAHVSLLGLNRHDRSHCACQARIIVQFVSILVR
jgi:hypothetical protein